MSLHRSGNQSIHHCLNLFEMLVRSEHPLKITEIADRLGLSLSPVHHLLRALLDRGYVTHLGARKGYVMGPSFTNLYTHLTAELHLANLAKPHLEQLNAECDDETCYLGFLHRYYVESLHTVLSSKLLSLGRTKTKQHHLHAIAQGKVLLSSLSEKEYAQWKQDTGTLRPVTPLTIRHFKQLDKEIEEVRRNGYAENVQESEEGVYVAACPIFNFQGRAIAVMAVGLPIQRLTAEKRLEYLNRLQRKSALLSQQLGYTND